MTHCRLSSGFGTTPKSKPPAWPGVHKTVNGAYRYRYAPFLMSTYYIMGRSPLALPLGELSPQVTERVLQPFSNDKINLCAHITEIPVVRGVSSPCEAVGHFLIEHCLLVWSLVALSVLATLGHLSQRERQGMLARYTERYRSAPFICSTNWSLPHRSDLLLCLILSCGFEICNSSPGRHYCRD